MASLILNGWLTNDDGVALRNNKESYWGNVIAEKVRYWADDVGVAWKDDIGLGRDHGIIKDVNMRFYITDDQCTLEEAEIALVDKFEGVCMVNTSLVGYSEYTITGMNVDEFTIGGHDIEKELHSYIGKYCWIVIEC